MSKRSERVQRTTRLAASVTVAASTFALMVPLGLPTSAAARIRAAPAHRASHHATRVSWHDHHAGPFYLADLTAASARPDFAVTPLTAVAAIRPHERLTPTASARGPPDPAVNP